MVKKESLKSIASKGMVWSALEKLLIQIGQIVIGVILARLLMPEDFGLIGMLSIFMAISQTFVESGMGSGLIQKKKRTKVDYSTVFVFNFWVSLLFYIILYFTAPLIAEFYDMPQLTILTRVLALNIVINSLTLVQRTRLTIKLDFKTIAKVNVVSVFISGFFGILFAYLGYGVWALIIQYISNAIIVAIMYLTLSRWRPSLRFSKKSFKELFGFGSKLLLSGLYSQAMNNVYNITIGKVFSSADLGYFTRAKSFAELTAGTVTSVLHQVTFPILASVQEDKQRMVAIFSQMVRMSAFLIFPAMTILSVLADPFIRLVLTEKWLPVVPLLQWMCFSRIFYPVSVINMNILNAVGRSDLFLKVDLSKFPILVIALIVTIPLGIKAMVIGLVITSFMSFLINAYMPGKLFGYGIFSQLRDMVPVFVATGITAISVYLVNQLFEPNIFKLVFGVISGIIVYLLSSMVLQIKELQEIKILINNSISKKN